MNTITRIGLGAALTVPAIVLSSCGQSPEDLMNDTAAVMEELGAIGKDIQAGKLTEDDAISKIEDCTKKLEEIKKLSKEMENDPEKKKAIEEYYKTEAFSKRMKNAEAGMVVLFDLYGKSSNDKFKAAIDAFGNIMM